MSDFLTTIVESKRREVAERRRLRPLETLGAPDAGGSSPARRDLHAALAAEGLSVIAEIKRRSPSKGPIRPDADPSVIARAYERNGAAAVSVLTDREFFGGGDADLIAAREAVRLPVLRKDFTIESYQIHEARALGADAVLLIARILTDRQLAEFVALSLRLELAALVEVHDPTEVGRALAAGARIVGINSRDLATFKTDLDAAVRLRDRVPAGTLTVAESGIGNRRDIQTVREAGFDACLIGETLMSAADPGAALRGLLGEPA